jgi:hypothetical protein
LGQKTGSQTEIGTFNQNKCNTKVISIAPSCGNSCISQRQELGEKQQTAKLLGNFQGRNLVVSRRLGGGSSQGAACRPQIIDEIGL